MFCLGILGQVRENNCGKLFNMWMKFAMRQSILAPQNLNNFWGYAAQRAIGYIYRELAEISHIQLLLFEMLCVYVDRK